MALIIGGYIYNFMVLFFFYSEFEHKGGILDLFFIIDIDNFRSLSRNLLNSTLMKEKFTNLKVQIVSDKELKMLFADYGQLTKVM